MSFTKNWSKAMTKKELIKCVKADRASGMTYKTIAEKYNINAVLAYRYGKRPADKLFVEDINEKYERLLPVFLACATPVSVFCKKNGISYMSFAKFLDAKKIDYNIRQTRVWTKNEIAIVKADREAGCSFASIGKKINRSAHAVQKTCERMAIVVDDTKKTPQRHRKPTNKPLLTDGTGPEPKEWRYKNVNFNCAEQKPKYDLTQYSGITPTMWQREQVQTVANVMAWTHDEARAAIKYTRQAVGVGGKV
jgi:hypothetical protein